MFHIVGGSAIFGVTVRLEEIPDLLTEFFRRYPDTTRLEQVGNQLLHADFEERQIPDFVIAVCTWGGYSGVAGRVLKHNTLGAIRTAFANAVLQLDQNPAMAGRALTEINRLRGLGTPSFASKHLRFLNPALCPVYDSVLRTFLPYAFNPVGYQDFATDCVNLGYLLRTRGIKNPVEGRNDTWFAADVEAAIFAQVNRWLQ